MDSPPTEGLQKSRMPTLHDPQRSQLTTENPAASEENGVGMAITVPTDGLHDENSPWFSGNTRADSPSVGLLPRTWCGFNGQGLVSPYPRSSHHSDHRDHRACDGVVDFPCYCIPQFSPTGTQPSGHGKKGHPFLLVEFKGEPVPKKKETRAPLSNRGKMGP